MKIFKETERLKEVMEILKREKVHENISQTELSFMVACMRRGVKPEYEDSEQLEKALELVQRYIYKKEKREWIW